MSERILVNLLLNVVSHGAPPVRVASRRGPGGTTVEILVADAGPGVPPGEERRIFQPFVHGGSASSAGISLALARALAEAQDGDRLPAPPAARAG